MPDLCDAIALDSYADIVDEVPRRLIISIEESERDHYIFLHADLAKYERYLTFWLHHGADLNHGVADHPD